MATHLVCVPHLHPSIPITFSFPFLTSTSSLFQSRNTGCLSFCSASMSPSSNGCFHRDGKVVVVVAALLGVMCGPVAGMQSSASPRRGNLNVLPDWQLSPPPPPPDYVQFPPPVHHHHHHPPPPSPLSPSSPSARPHGRRLLGGEHVADPNERQTGTSRAVDASSSPGKCVTSAAPPYVVPVGAPYPYGDDLGEPSSAPAPSPTSGADGGQQPALAPQSGDDNSTMAHTTMVSAMQFNQCTYTIITTTGNIEGGGTTADVNAEFFNKDGDSVLFVNLRSQNRNFNRGATDTFTVVGDCVPDICRMHLSHDDSGPDAGWFVNTVTVSLLYQTHVFNVFEWLAKDEPPYSLSRIVSSCPA